MKQTQSPLDQEPTKSQLKLIIENGELNNEQIAEKFGTTEASIRRFKVRHQIQEGSKALIAPNKEWEPYFSAESDKIDILTNEKLKEVGDQDKITEQLGLTYIDHAQWDIGKLYLSEKGTSISFVPRKHTASIRPALTDGWKAPLPASQKTGERLVVIVGDQHAPHQDQNLHRLFCQWLKDNKPDEGISLGDLADFATISKHAADPDNDAEIQECIDESYNILRGYRNASLDTRWKIMPGNHDDRLRQLILNTPAAKVLHGLRPAQIEGQTQYGAFSLPTLWHLNDLQFEYIDPHGQWEQGKVAVTPKLIVKHGHSISQGSGKTALQALDKCRYNVIHGHSHRQAVVYKTTFDANGDPNTQIAAEAGCMCKIEKELSGKGRVWPNYTDNHDWQQGFVTVQVFDNGMFKLDLATYIKGNLLWRDKIYE